jgi:hypothetical protein
LYRFIRFFSQKLCICIALNDTFLSIAAQHCLKDKTRDYHEMRQGEHVHVLQALQRHNHHAAQPQVPPLSPAKQLQHLKGLSHVIDFKNFDKNLQN